MFKKSLIAYEHIVYWSDEDRCYIGERPELFSASMAMMLRQSLGNCGKQWRKSTKARLAA